MVYKIISKVANVTNENINVVTKRLSVLPPRWKNWITRGIMGLILIFSFIFLIYCGPLALIFLCLMIQMTCFHEITNIANIIYKSKELPWFRSLNWFFLFVSNYYFFGENWIDQFRIFLLKEQFFEPLITYHRFISFSLYCGGVIVFVISLVKRHYLQQFSLFGWTHVTLFILVTSSHLIMRNIFHGIIWFVVPITMIVMNDIMAYMFGFFFGRTPLIKLSPNKTWEGFIGGGVSSVIFGVLLSYFLVPYDYFVCPVAFDIVNSSFKMDCVRNHVFQPVLYRLPTFLLFESSTITWYPFLNHSFILGLFVAIIGPFGGFFASGFKRAFRLKDFGTIFPGHGGFVDRFDTQFLTGTFVYVYYDAFVRQVSVTQLLHQLSLLTSSEQLVLHRKLAEALVKHFGDISINGTNYL